MAARTLQVGFVIDGLLPRWPRVWQWLRGCPSSSSVGEMRYGWIAREISHDPQRRSHYTLYRPGWRYDAVIFLKSMSTECQQLARKLREAGTRVLFDVNVDYFTPASGTFYYQGMAPTEQQTSNARRMADVCDALIADSSHLAKVCAQHHREVRWIPDDVDFRFVPEYRPWKPGAKLDLLWSGESVKLFELLKIEPVLRRLAPHLRLVLMTNSLSSLDRWFEPWKSRFEALLKDIEHVVIPFTNIPALLEVYAQGGVFISPRFLDNSYNLGHTEWKIALPMACGRVALGTPQQSYRDVAERSGGQGLRLCETDDEWLGAFDEILSGRFDFHAEEAAAREVIEKHYSTPIVATMHRAYLEEVCSHGR